MTITLTWVRQLKGDRNEGTQFIWFLSLYARLNGGISWTYCFKRLWPSGKYMYRVSYDSRNRTFLWNDDLQWARPHYCRGFTITRKHIPPSTHTHTHTVGLLWTSDQTVAETSTWQHTTLTTDTHAPGGIRTRNTNKRAAAKPRFRPHGQWDRPLYAR
jgi:hypothetical protein